MEMKHFSHEEHPLILNQLPNKTDDSDPVLCYGCQKQILEVEAYSCLPCQFFLHKKCAELPKQIRLPIHSIHPLVLHKKPPYRSGACICNACRIEDWKFFTYHCSICEFDLHVSCAILDPSFEHDSHEHPLISLPRPAIFTCNACLTRSEDASYVCSICPFWIHKTCASLPKILNYKDHNHSLWLAYSIPLEHRNFPKFCVVCHEPTHPADWCYYCGPCRYFIHLKCLASETKSTKGINIPISSASSLTAAAGNNDQMNTEDSMAEYPALSSVSRAPVFGQQPVSPSPGGYMFASTIQSQTSPFQFVSQQNQTAPQNMPLFPALGSQKLHRASGNISMGSGGVGRESGDRSGRKFVKITRSRNRKK